MLGNNDLEKIVALLLWMAQDFQSNIHIDDVHYAALEVVIKHVDAATGGTLGSLRPASVAKLPELIDIMMLHKDGSPKDANATFTFMRRSAKIREELRAITMLQRVDTFIKSREVKNRNHWVQWTIVTDE